MTRVAIKAFHPLEGDVHDLAPKTLTEYTEWVFRAAERGYKAKRLTDDIVRVESDQPGCDMVFTIKIIENPTCAADYTRWNH